MWVVGLRDSRFRRRDDWRRGSLLRRGGGGKPGRRGEVAPTSRRAHHRRQRRRDEYVIFLELCTEELFALVERRHTLTEKECKRFMWQLLGSVDHMHGMGVLHRDLKLENLMLTSDLSLRVIDFGRAAPPARLQPPDPEEIGRASCRERV